MILKFNAIFLFLICTSISFGQFEYGVKAGINLTTKGDITDIDSDLTSVENIKDNMTGYFIGSYFSTDFLFLYLRPEVQFSHRNTNFNSFSVSQSRLEAPISIGYKILPFFSCFAGPTFQYNFNPKFENISFSKIDENTSVGIHIGIRFDLGPFNADIRFDRGLSPEEINLLEQNEVPISGKIDTRSKLWSLGISYNF